MKWTGYCLATFGLTDECSNINSRIHLEFRTLHFFPRKSNYEVEKNALFGKNKWHCLIYVEKSGKVYFFSRLFNYNNNRYFLSGFLKPFAAKNGTHVAKNHMVSWHKDFLLWPLWEKTIHIWCLLCFVWERWPWLY